MNNRYSNIDIFRINNSNETLGSRYFKGVKYPEVELNENDIYVITTVGDRYDLLAQQYYGDPGFWWIIPISNNGDFSSEVGFGSLYPPPGSQIRIPANLQKILSDYSRLNSL